MTCREKLAKEDPTAIGGQYVGGCCGCPWMYGYLPKPDRLARCAPASKMDPICRDCWNREVPEENEENNNSFWPQVQFLIEEAMKKHDRFVSVLYDQDGTISVSVYPLSEKD